jgi:hypothetical protein
VHTGSVVRHGRGWRGLYREDGRNRATGVTRTKGEARAELNAELARIRLGAAYRPPITLTELADRFLAQHPASDQTIEVRA